MDKLSYAKIYSVYIYIYIFLYNVTILQYVRNSDGHMLHKSVPNTATEIITFVNHQINIHIQIKYEHVMYVQIGITSRYDTVLKRRRMHFTRFVE